MLRRASRFHQFLLIASTVALSWLGMQIVHGLGSSPAEVSPVVAWLTTIVLAAIVAAELLVAERT